MILSERSHSVTITSRGSSEGASEPESKLFVNISQQRSRVGCPQAGKKIMEEPFTISDNQRIEPYHHERCFIPIFLHVEIAARMAIEFITLPEV
jgi:hypothetical protein